MNRDSLSKPYHQAGKNNITVFATKESNFQERRTCRWIKLRIGSLFGIVP